MLKKVLPICCLILSSATCFAQKKSIEQRVDSVLRLMTLDEKVGQLNQYSGEWAQTGPITHDGDKQNQIRRGQVGSMLNVMGFEHTTQMQQMARESRLKIPLILGQDVIHGYRTTFPLPLAEAASWDIPAIELSARIAATEASAQGIHWTFAPMVDISRDPRWGRVMEGAGEDAYLGSKIAAARVRGFQGKGPGDTTAVLACVKHFAAYGAGVGGRDYNSVDMSLRQFHEVYLPPYKAAAEAGAATFMNSFNDLNGVPATANSYLMRSLLKGDWKFNGFVVSDWGSVGEMINHGFSADNKEAALQAITAGCDMDMESRSYTRHLAQLVREKKVPVKLVDDAVRRILRKKFELGLFDDPFRYSNQARQENQYDRADHRAAARSIAAKSIVLLKNEQQILPLKKKAGKIALIGPFGRAVRDHLGFWSFDWPDDSSRIVTIYDAIREKITSGTEIRYAPGCGISDSSTAGFAEAVALASSSDVAIITVGEARDMSGEAKSRSNIHLPGVQEELIKAVKATGKPVIVLIAGGRPLIFNWTADHADAILFTWWLGMEAGHAIADVLFGDYNPSGKLPMTFPRTEGQIPVYYNHYNTGRPAADENQVFYVSAYTDLPNSPKFPFGYGLSYTKFSYSTIQLNKTTIKKGETLIAKVVVSNTGDFDGEEVVQLYLRDKVASVVRPVKELKGFEKRMIKKGTSETFEFRITEKDLRFCNPDLKWISEPGAFDLMIGGSSATVQSVPFTLAR